MGRRTRLAKWFVACGLFLSLFAPLTRADEFAERAAELEKLSAEQKDDLRRKKERFDALPAQERQRLRDLHESLLSAPDSEELVKVMQRYCDWLDSLESGPRLAVLNLPPAERIEMIKELVSDQESKRIQDYVQYDLPEKDRDAIYRWLEKFVDQHEDDILDELHDDDRRRIRKINDDQARHRTLITRLPYRRFNRKMPYPDKEDIETMVASLSETTRKQLEKSPAADEQRSRASELVGAAISSIAVPPPTEEELRKFYLQLPPEQQARLDSMDRDQMRRELRQMYRYSKFQEREKRGGPPRGGDGRDDDRRGGDRRDDDRNRGRGPHSSDRSRNDD
ncbi:MAG: hypothetical protein WD872_12540 [Pirellulaceae bacterium]